ncbi:OprO/OprP family phosphate-selective porin [Gemmata sp.]|uniref:OprO/OprP family phosphate-selective porin n=1 Tax=Gemmata sp. TaxID=1914242 RepID=UPI003F70578A
MRNHLIACVAVALLASSGVRAQERSDPPAKAEEPSANAEPSPSEPPGREAAERLREASDGWPVKVRFNDGFALTSLDDQFELRLRLLAQNDAKLFTPTDQQPARSGMYIPRFRVYFEGQLTDPFQYELSVQRSVEGAFDVLDANVNVRFAKQFQVRFGRGLVPYSYDWYDHLEQYFIAPERGLFALNLGLSRQSGIMAWGEVWDERVRYAVGGFTGQLAGLADVNNSRDAVGYLNVRPFLKSASVPALRGLYFGGSIGLGTQAYEAELLPVRTSIQTSENDEAASSASSVFLDYNEGVVASGARRQGALHAGWYGLGFSVESEAYLGQFGVTRPETGVSALIPVTGYNVTVGYFLTGEEVLGRGPVDPRRPFTARRGTGPGAFEPFVRYSELDYSRKVFTNGFADPDKWTRNAGVTDLGVNWYWNRYIKWTFDWQHASFGSPVLVNESKGKYATSLDLFWLRCQVYY